MSVGQIIASSYGSAVVVEVLPATFNLGSQTLRQVVAEPLSGGPAPPIAASGDQPITPYQALQAQAAAAFLAFVAVPMSAPATQDVGGSDASANGRTGAHASAAQAYGMTQARAGQTPPTIVAIA